MIGFNASFERIADGACPDRVYVEARFCTGGCSMPLAYREQILRLPGIARIGYNVNIRGYYQYRKNPAHIFMVDEGWCRTQPEYNITPARCRQLQELRTGVFVSHGLAERYHLKTGDAFPVLTNGVTRADGGKLWPFTVIGILDDIPIAPTGYIIGNYGYFDQTRPLAERGTAIGYVLDARSPTRPSARKQPWRSRPCSPIPAIPSMPRPRWPKRRNPPRRRQHSLGHHGGGGRGPVHGVVLAGNGNYQSVRERIPEFAVLKTLGFSDWGVTALAFAEAAIPARWGR